MKSYSEKLNSVIEILDREEDALIIELLKAKIDKIDKYYPLKTKDVQGAKNHSLSQLSLFLRKELYNINAYKKSNEILERFECEKCPFSSLEEYKNYRGELKSFKTYNDTERCKRCNDRKDSLQNIIEGYESRVNRTIENISSHPENEMFFKTKALINKINRTLKTKNL